MDDILDIMYERSEKHNDPVMMTSTLVQSVISFIRHTPNRFPSPNLRNIPAQVVKRLLEAEQAGEVVLTREGSAIIRVFFCGYFIRRITRRLHEIRREPEIPFPTVTSLALDVPENLIHPVNAQDQLVDFMEEVKREQEQQDGPRDHDNRLIRLIFSADIEPLLLPYAFLSRDLILICLQKIRFYLRNERNQSYMRQKMLAVFRHREKLVEDTFTAILSRPETVLEDIWKPNEFSYYFWIQITTTITKEYTEKKEKTINEQNYIQASILLGMLLAHRKSLLQRENDREQALKQLETHLRSEPFLFTTNKIFEFTDKNGVPLTKKLSHQDIISYIERAEVPRENEKIPPLVRLTSGESREYVRKDLLFPAFFQHARKVRERLNQDLIKEWSRALNLGVRLVEMQNQDAFEASIQERVARIDPSLSAMLDFSLLYFASREVPLSEQIKAELRKILDTKKLTLKPLSSFFQLDRTNLYSDAKLLLPVWKTIPVLAGLIRMLQKLFIGIDREEEAERHKLREKNRQTARQFAQERDRTAEAGKAPRPSKPRPAAQKTDTAATSSADSGGTTETSSQQRERIRTSAKEVLQSLSSGYDNPEDARQAALERWNTIIDRKHRKNLTIDVENLARDHARRMLRKRGTPTLERVQEMARNLAKKDVFESIRDKKSLELFIALTIAKQLRQ
ncbi:hypothetical protein [Spirochaeta africana]|nr:hypothetical protein [Spirochaeta africana]